MENASKALIIAGAILLSILIIAIGMFVYNSAQSTINDSLSQMSTSEKNAFNSAFTGYQGNQTGSQVKSLLGDLITNSATYAEETGKIVNFKITGIKAGDNNKESNATRPNPGEVTNNYVNTLNSIKNSIENKHTYWVVVNQGTAGIVDEIFVYYNKPANAESGS